MNQFIPQAPIAFIDNFINEPVNHCVNEFTERTGYPITYHQPAKYGFSSLNELKVNPRGIVILGSASHITEGCEWHTQLLDWVIPFLDKGIPVFGICFGHQLLASYYGGDIKFVDPKQNLFIQARKLSFNQSFLGVSAGEEVSVPYAHQQVVGSLPSGFEVAAHSDKLAYEVLVHKTKHVYLMQGHPESSLVFIRDKLGHNNEVTSEQIKENGNRFLDGFLKLCINL
jgi:GMP synthase (glutamine-hydrolysing)